MRIRRCSFEKLKRKNVTILVFGIYLFLLIWLVMFKFSVNLAEISCIRSINLIPFGASAIVNGHIGMKEIVYNILVFVPLGVYAGMKEDYSFPRKCMVGAFTSLVFEILQYVFAIGASDITDVINNTIGGIIGVFLFALLKKILKHNTVGVVNAMGIAIEFCAILLINTLIIVNS